MTRARFCFFPQIRMSRIRFFAACAMAAVFCFPPFACLAKNPDSALAKNTELSLEEKPAERRFSATRHFTGRISRNDAVFIAQAAAHAAAMRSAIHDLALLPEVRIAGLPGDSLETALNTPVLAHATVKTSLILVTESRKAATVSVVVAIDDDGEAPDLAERVRETLVAPARLELFTKAVQREHALLQTLDTVLPPPDSVADAPLPQLPEQDEDQAIAAVNELRALQIYKEALPLYDGVWRHPEKIREYMLAALALAPESALIRNALGDASLQLGRSQEAQEEQTRAIRSDPAFARAYHSRGVASLALGYLSSAVADFSEAMRLDPRKPLYSRDRGLAHHLMGDNDAMCRDLRAACSMGECVKLQWALDGDLCSQP